MHCLFLTAPWLLGRLALPRRDLKTRDRSRYHRCFHYFEGNFLPGDEYSAGDGRLDTLHAVDSDRDWHRTFPHPAHLQVVLRSAQTFVLILDPWQSQMYVQQGAYNERYHPQVLHRVDVSA